MTTGQSKGAGEGFLNVVVCGKFHYGNYLSVLHESGALRHAYFSHRRQETLGLAPTRFTNLWLKEYFLHACLRVAPPSWRSAVIAISHKIWGAQLRASFRVAPINLFLLHGNSTEAMRTVRRAGGLNVGEAVNIHPTELAERLDIESRRCGSRSPQVDGASRILEEVELLDYLLCPSAAVAESYVRHGFDRRRVKVLPYGFTGGAMAPERVGVAFRSIATREALKLICIGQLNVRKGQHLLLAELKRLIASGVGPKIQLQLVGSADSDYLAHLRNLDVPFEHLTHLAHPALLELLSQQDVLILPSIEDGFGVVVTEAIAQGTRVMVSIYAGASELVERHGGGVVFDPYSSRSFETAWHRCIGGEFDAFTGEGLDWQSYAQALEAAVSEINVSRLDSE